MTEVLGDKNLSDKNGRNSIAAQFVAHLRVSRTTLDELALFDKKSFDGTIDAILSKINTYTMLKPTIRHKLMQLKQVMTDIKSGMYNVKYTQQLNYEI